MPTIILDPGHNSYGQDTGAEGNGLREQDIVLDICKKLKPLLEYNGFNVVITRIGDLVTGLSSGYTLNQSLQYRVNIANNAKADLLVSVHVNAGGGTGSEVYALSVGGKDEKCAKAVAPYLAVAGSWNNRGVKFSSSFYVLKYADMPAILTESGFIDTTADANKLAQDSYRQKIAVAHAKGICEYFGIQYKKEEENDVLNNAVVYYSAKDYSVALIVAEKLGGCAMFCRNATATVHPEALAAKHLVIVGGLEVMDHPNVANCCGETAADTAILAAQYAKKL